MRRIEKRERLAQISPGLADSDQRLEHGKPAAAGQHSYGDMHPSRFRTIGVAEIGCSIQIEALKRLTHLKTSHARLIAPPEKIVLREWPDFDVEDLRLG